MLKGYKTYITAVVAVVTAAGAYLAGDMSLGDAMNVVVPAIIGATLRSGLNTTAAK